MESANAQHKGGKNMELKKTPLHGLYAQYGGKTVEFGGWDMPIQFSGILEEHHAVRNAVGLFDVSHMGEFQVTGVDARQFIQHMVTNDVSRLNAGRAMYSLMTNENGMCIDDVLIYSFSNTKFWIVVNAGNIEKDFQWLLDHQTGFDVLIQDISSELSLLALQGPNASKLMEQFVDNGLHLSTLKPFHFIETKICDCPVVLSATGYTGEPGYEIYIQRDEVDTIWRILMEKGQVYDIKACGLGCRDTLRLEARLPLYGHELNENISPLEAGLSAFVKLDGEDFIGRDALRREKETGLKRKLVGIQLIERGIPRSGYKVFVNRQEIGFMTSGTMSPTLKIPIGLALIDASYAEIGQHVQVDIRGKQIDGVIVKTPFYRRNSEPKVF